MQLTLAGRGDDTFGNPSSSSNFSILVVRAYPLIEIRQTAPCQATRGKSISVSSNLPPSSLGAGFQEPSSGLSQEIDPWDECLAMSSGDRASAEVTFGRGDLGVCPRGGFPGAQEYVSSF